MILELSPVHSKQEFKFDKVAFCNFLASDVLSFWEKKNNNWNIDDGIINLYSLFDNKISQYSLLWDRSTLTKVIFMMEIIYILICCKL